MEISAYSLLALCNAAKPIMAPGCSVLALTYFGGEKVVPGYNVMGICKAALDACVKYAAFDLGPAGIRVNAISAGPLRTLAARAVGSDGMEEVYSQDGTVGSQRHARRSRPHRGVFAVDQHQTVSPAKFCTLMPATTSWARQGECWMRLRSRR